MFLCLWKNVANYPLIIPVNPSYLELCIIPLCSTCNRVNSGRKEFAPIGAHSLGVNPIWKSFVIQESE